MNEVEIVLLKTKGYEPDGKGYEKEIFEEIPLFAEEKAVYSKEFYEAQRLGIKLDITLVIKPYEYDYETKLIYNGAIYKVERTYKKNTEQLELICSKVE